ncbi:MAG: alkaline phosphatase [Holophagaceae bacterium]|nr:alkaline phosphatase [Holophagaceae bacterium]
MPSAGVRQAFIKSAIETGIKIASAVLRISLGLSLILAHAISLLAAGQVGAPAPDTEIKNIIVMIADGTSLSGLTLARWYKAYDVKTGTIDTKATLAIDELASGLVRTYWSDGKTVGAITDSAPAATSFACGIKTIAGYVGMGPDKVPAASILEAARLIGKSTGLVATSNIQHATPAGFSAHYSDRNKYDIIGEQQAYNGIDVVLGGGSVYLEEPYRKDSENIIDAIKVMGYRYVTTKNEMEATKEGRLWGMFAPDAMAYDIDREELSPSEPSLAEMTAKAIQLLSKSNDGFFLMVEGSKPDWMAHVNEPVGLVTDILAFDAAVGIALDFAKTSQNTMLLITSDHGTGGISIGNVATNGNYSREPLTKFIAPLKKASLSGAGIAQKLNEGRTNVIEVMKAFFGIEDLTEAEERSIANASVGRVQNVAGSIISRRANIGWTTTGHTGEDVLLSTYLPGDRRITGVLDNVDITKICADAWGVDLKALTQGLFCNAETAFRAIGAHIEIDTSVQSGGKMTATKGDRVLVIHENKNFVLLNEKKIMLDSIVVQQGGVFYVNAKVLSLLSE